jgi:hypothetical protein
LHPRCPGDSRITDAISSCISSILTEDRWVFHLLAQKPELRARHGSWLLDDGKADRVVEAVRIAISIVGPQDVSSMVTPLSRKMSGSPLARYG